MTVSSATNKVSYSGNGSTTVFAYTFKIFDQDDLTVILRSATGTETTQTITTHYSVSGVGNTGGGNVTMGTAPASGTTLTILREQPLTQGLDLVANDAFPAASMEDALDKLTMQMQRINEEIDRSIKASKTNTISSTEFTDSATDRASKVLAFDASGNLTVSQELGTFKGNWAASTAYVLRDLVKDTSTNNIFICTTAHTSSGSQPLTTNTDASKWSLLVDVSSVLALSGGTMTGNIVMAGSQTVDGRDLSVDGAKLDGIENNATADQTASEILTAIKTVDGASSGLDADLLDGQHGSYYTGYADTAVSNLVDSAPEALNTLNELAAALGDDANFSTTVTNSIATKLPLAGGTMTGNIVMSATETVDGRDLSVDGDKLDLIEANATADQTKSEIDALNINADQLDGEHGSYYETNTANVTAAGALMDSELTSEASVKAINQGLATSDSPTFNKVTMPLGSSSGVVIGSDDIKIYQAFGESYFLANSGNVNLQATENNHDVIIKTDDGSGGVAEYFKADGSEGEAQLFHYGDQKLSTKSTGVELYSNDTGFASGPIFSLHRDSSSPAAWDNLGVVQFNGEDSNSNKIAFASLVGRIVDPAIGSTDGRIELWQMLNSTSTLCYVFDHDSFRLTNEQPLRWYNHGGTSYDVDLTAATPSADRTITLPDRTGEVVVSDGAVGTDATALIGRGKLGYSGLSDVFSISHEDYGTSYLNLGFAQNVNGYSWVNAPSGAYPSLRVAGSDVLQAKATEIIAKQDIKLDTNKNLVFEGATANDYETTVTVADPTADQTITLPNQTGTAMLWQSAWPDDTGTIPNYAIGDEALNSLVSGGEGNVAYGYQALRANTTGSTNVAIGNYALVGNTVGVHNTAVGYGTGDSSNGAIGSGTYVGSNAGNHSLSGKDYQTAVGAFAMNDQYGDYTTAVGYNAMSDGDHYRSTAVGYYALARSSTGSPYYNTAVGHQSGDSLWSGDGNTLVGHDTDTYYWGPSYGVAVGYQSITSTYGVSIGYRAGYSLTNYSDDCVVIGKEAGYDLDGGDYCVFIGSQAGRDGGTGNYNTSVGATSLKSLTNGTYNSALGNSSLLKVTSGAFNSSLGNKAGYNLTTGSNNTFLGHNAGYIQDGAATNALTTGSNVTCVGSEAMPSSGTATNEITLGDNDITSLRCNVQTISSLSDERDKTAIADLTYGLDFINDMRPVEFTWNRRDGSLGAKTDMGFIAQDLYETELNHSSSSRTRLVNWENPEKLEADYVRSYPILVKAVQQLSAKCDALEARLVALEGA